MPPSFKLPLVNQEATEGNSIFLRCELNKPASSLEWRRGGELLKHGDKYQMRKKDLQAEMKIVDVSLDDAGEYSCVCGEQSTTASVIVNGACNTLIQSSIFFSSRSEFSLVLVII